MFDPLDHASWRLVWWLTLPVMLLSIVGLASAPLLRRRFARLVVLMPLFLAAGLWWITFSGYPGTVSRTVRLAPGDLEKFEFADVRGGYGGVSIDPLQSHADSYRAEEIVVEVIEVPSRIVHQIAAGRLSSRVRVDFDRDELEGTRLVSRRPRGLIVGMHGPTNPGSVPSRIEFSAFGGARFWHDSREARGYFLAYWRTFWAVIVAIAVLIAITGWTRRGGSQV